MKKLLLFIFLLLSINFVLAEDCPIGLVNDTAPGSCGLYIDKNTDSLCDLSQDLNDSCDQNLTVGDLDSTQIKSMTVKQVAEYYGIEGEKFAEEISKLANIKVKTSDSFQVLHDNYGVRPINVGEVATALKQSTPVPVVQEERTHKTLYNSLLLSIITIVLYSMTWLLSYGKKISVFLHRKIWNWILLIVFIPVFLTSLFWLLRVDYGIITSLPFNITFWHVEFGIVMIIISIFHIAWHTSYYIKK